MGGLQKGRGYLSVMDKRTGGCGQFQSSINGNGRGREECMCDNEGIQWNRRSCMNS